MPTLTRGIAKYAAEGCLVKPVFHQWVQDDDIPFEFTVRVERPKPRPPDDWFHASAHPLATYKQLYDYLTVPQERRSMDYNGRMGVMFGSLAHAVVETFLDYMGVAVPLPAGSCVACGLPHKSLLAGGRPGRHCSEHAAVDPATRSRCHMDSILHFKPQGTFGFDLKTIKPWGKYGLDKAPDMDLEFFTERWPEYWAQMQECMRLSGLRKYIVFFMSMGNPWELREYHIPYDPVFATQTEAKYLTVREHVAQKRPILL
jgi:hypothetical protein